MALIFIGSGDALSSAHTSRFLGPLLHWLLPDLATATADRLEFGIRKCGHLTEYAVLALLFWHAVRASRNGAPQSWHWSDAALSQALAALYAVADEVHQAFVPSRQGSGWDVALDSCGAAAGLLLWWAVARRRRDRRNVPAAVVARPDPAG